MLYFNVKIFEWDIVKNIELKIERNISFEELVIDINEGKLLDDIVHPNLKKYPNQRILVVEHNDYAYLLPYVEDEEKIFLKTIIPSRKMTKHYLR